MRESLAAVAASLVLASPTSAQGGPLPLPAWADGAWADPIQHPWIGGVAGNPAGNYGAFNCNGAGFFHTQGQPTNHEIGQNAVHVSLIPKGVHQGKLLIWDHWHYTGQAAAQTRGLLYSIWDATDSIHPGVQLGQQGIAPNPESFCFPMPAGKGDLFCAGHAWTTNGDLLVVGGTKNHDDGTGLYPRKQPGYGSARISGMHWRVILCSIGMLATTTSAQETLWQRVGVDGQLYMGNALHHLGDLNNDGYQDWWTVGEIGASLDNYFFVLSGWDGTTLRSTPLTSFPRPIGDWDADGLSDYSTVTPGPSGSGPVEIKVISGRDDSSLLTLPITSQFAPNFGSDITSDLDGDGDGRMDLVIGARQSFLIYTFDHDGNLLHTVTTPFWQLGQLGADMDGDGGDDFLVAALGDVHVYSGRTGALITVAGGEVGAGLGSGVLLGVGDVNADGIPDFAASSNGALVPGLVQVFAGTTGAKAKPIHTFRNSSRGIGSGAGFGRAVAVGDLDLDSFPDLLVGSAELTSGGRVGGKIHWYTLREGRRVRTMLPIGSSFVATQFGTDVTIGAPHPDHPSPVFAAGEPLFGLGQIFNAVGRVALYRVGPPSIEGIGPGCRGATSQSPLLGVTPWAESLTRVHLSAAPPSAPALLALGTSNTTWAGLTLPWPLTPFGLPGCNLRVAIDVVVPVVTGNHGNEFGHAFVELPAAVASGTPCALVHGQWIVLDPGGIEVTAVSNAVTWGHSSPRRLSRRARPAPSARRGPRRAP